MFVLNGVRAVPRPQRAVLPDAGNITTHSCYSTRCERVTARAPPKQNQRIR